MSTDVIGEVAKYAGVAGVAVLVIGMMVHGLAKSSAFSALRPWQSFVVVLVVIVVVAMIAMTALFGSMPQLAAMLRQSDVGEASSTEGKDKSEIDIDGPADNSSPVKEGKDRAHAVRLETKAKEKPSDGAPRSPTKVAEPAPPICPGEVGKRAERDGVQSLVEFRNFTKGTITLHWIDYAGTRRPYATVSEGQTRTIYSYTGHPWVISDSSGKCIDFFVTEGLLMQRDFGP